MEHLTWDENGFYVEGERKALVSGEFHYYRVPERDWRERLARFQESGGNMVATYIPWCVHEPREGEYCFDDVPGRNLTAFLKLCKEMGMLVMVRPGPYVYSEMTNSGLPQWLLDAHPEITACRADGTPFEDKGIVSYLHPAFLEAVRPYYRKVCEQIRPFLATNGGPIAMVQVENELCGIHLWNGFADYNPQAMGIGAPDGLYTCFLKKRYGSVAALNAAYGKAYEDFAEADPRLMQYAEERSTKEDVPEEELLKKHRMEFDYFQCYEEGVLTYLKTLSGWLREDGIDVPLCTNAGGTDLVALFKDAADTLPSPFFIGVDHYYCLGQKWGRGNGPTPQRYLKWVMSMDFLQELGMPPAVLELQAGSPATFPPILKEDLMAAYMANVAAGMKGMNYYVLTGGMNFKDTGTTGDLYDYQAPISADNQVRPTYQAVEACTEFVHGHSWLQGTSRYYDVQLGFSWSQRLSPLFGARDKAAADYITDGLHFALTGAGFQPRYRELCGALDISRPLVIACGETMEEAGQRCVVEFLEKGGNVVLGPLFPHLDERGNPCTILRDYAGAGEVQPVNDTSKALLFDGTVIYGLSRQFTCEGWEEGLLYSERKGISIAGIRQVGAGKLLFLGTEFDYMYDSQNLLVTYLLKQLGCVPAVQCSNPNLWTTLWSDGTHGMLFAVNLLSGAQQADIRGTIGGTSFELGRVTVPAMCVRPVELTEQMRERRTETAREAGGNME